MMKKILFSALMMVSMAVTPAMAQSVQTQHCQKAKITNAGVCNQTATCANHNSKHATCNAGTTACKADAETCHKANAEACHNGKAQAQCTQECTTKQCSSTPCKGTQCNATPCNGQAKTQKAVRKGKGKKARK